MDGTSSMRSLFNPEAADKAMNVHPYYKIKEYTK